MKSIKLDNEFNILRNLSAELGSDPWQVQAAGGNTSLKIEDTMWIKASGAWLADALDTDQFVPVTLAPLLHALDENDPKAEKSIDFVRQELNTEGLRPSIETTVHAVLPQKVVLHVHCVDTISIAIQKDAQEKLSVLLKDFRWLWVPYLKPGLSLSRYISANNKTRADVIVLGNHGLVVAADTVDQSAKLLQRVRAALHQPMKSMPEPDLDALNSVCAGTAYEPAKLAQAHALAMDETAVSIAQGGSLYPDHVIFLGEGTTVASDQNALLAITNTINAETGSEPASVVIPGIGVLMHTTANASQNAMARCLSDVCLRVPDGSQISYLSNDETFELLNWESEKHRQSVAR